MVTGSGVGEGIPDVIWSIGTAPGAPVIVLGGRLVDVPVDVTGAGLVVLELTELLSELELGVGLTELELEVGFCLSTRWIWRAL